MRARRALRTLTMEPSGASAAHGGQAPATVAASFRNAFGNRVFTVIWIATVVSNVGGWMSSAATGWLMVSVNADPLVVSLVQVASSLPIFLFALPAGALADILDKRRFLIASVVAMTLVSAVYAALVGIGDVAPGSILLFTFLISVTGALGTPAWQSIVPELVPREDLSAAVAANSIGVNVSRVVGPALGGLAIGAIGIAAPLWVDAASNLAVIGALLWWRPRKTPMGRLPAERFANSIRIGLRYARHSHELRATLVRAFAFFLFASAYWALLPLVAASRIGGGPNVYGLLLGAIGAGAIGGGVLLPRLKTKIGANAIVVVGTVGTAVAMVLFGLARSLPIGLAASLIAGLAWIAVLATLNVSAQTALPDWVRGRGLAIYVTVFFGAMTAGSALWGEVATITGVPLAHFLAAAGALLAAALVGRWKLQAGAIDLAPSMHWPAPVVSYPIDGDRGPVLVTVEYRIASDHNRLAFLAALGRIAQGRRRDGAYAWSVFEDTAERDRFLEMFMVESWLEHLRQHERVTNADRMLQDHVLQLLDGLPVVTHLVTVEPVRAATDTRD